jgi:acetyltransferase
MPVANPVDLYPAVELHGRLGVYSRAIEVALEDVNVDVVIIHYPVGLEKEVIDLEALKKRADLAGKTLLFWIVGRQDAVSRFRRKAQILGIQVYGEISRAVDCLAAAARFQRRTEIGPADAGTSPQHPGDLEQFVTQDTPNLIWDEYDSKRLLSAWDMPVAEERVVSSLAEATAATRDFGFPVVLKGLPPGEIHKTESGLIHLGIGSQTELEAAYQEIETKLGGRGRILLQQQVDIDFELIAGFHRDDQFGPCVMFGLGGIFSELRADVVFALAPLKQSTALEFMGRIRGHKLLEGFRGMPPLNKELMADMLINLGNLSAAYPQIEQIDINPVAVVGGSPVAVDATVILKPS